MSRIRGDNGKFIQKSNEPRPVRSIRVTDSIWGLLGDIADQRCITRADLIEHFALNHVLHENLRVENERLKDEVAVLRSRLSGAQDGILQCELPLVPELNLASERNNSSEAYTERAFAEKIGLSRSTLVSKKKKYLDGTISDSDFHSYLREKDSLSRNWRYSLQDKKYYLNQQLSQNP